MIFLAKIKGYLIAFSVAALTLIGVYLKGSNDQKNKTKARQKEIELEAHKELMEGLENENKIENDKSTNRSEFLD